MAERKNSKLSLRYKIVALLVLLPTIGLGFYAFMVTNLFSKDKKAYIFDSSVIVSKALATQVKIEVDSFDKLLEPINQSINWQQKKFSNLSYDYFIRQNRAVHLFIYVRTASGEYKKVDEMYLPDRVVKDYLPGGEVLDNLLNLAWEDGFSIQDIPEAKRSFVVFKRVEMPEAPNKKLLVMALYKSPDLYEGFATPSAYKNYLISKGNFLSMEPKYFRRKNSAVKITSVDFFAPIFSNRFPVGIAEIPTDKGNEMLVSFAKVGRGGLIVASVIEKASAMKTIDKLIIESVLFVLALISITTVIGVIASFGLTSALSRLVEATKKIASGDFNIKVDIQSKDEVAQLADSINVMASEVSRLMDETAESARLVNELETVKLIQEMLFPADEARIGPLDLVGFFQPASECGGDWYHYSKVSENRALLWIGDVTGHGAPAALVTSAAKAVSSVIEINPEVTPAQALQVMNHAINATARGNILMTFFLASIDLNTGEMDYACASHEFPLVMPQKDQLKKKDLIPLTDSQGPRLGENKSAEYTQGKYQLQPGDTILMYTDGVIDLESPEGEVLGERNFLKYVLKSFGLNVTTKTKLEKLKESFVDYHKGTPLVDDLTLFACKYDPKV